MSNLKLEATDPREIAKWAERYARSRTIPFLVQWVFITTLVVVLGALSQGAILAWETGRSGLQWACVLVIAVLTLTLLWFSIAKGGRRQVWHISQWVYGREGYASHRGRRDVDERAKRMTWLLPVGLGLGIYHLIGLVIVGLGYLDMRYLQPFSALYMVPFLAMMILSQRLGLWAWIWPVLYAVHAVLLFTGVPIHFSGFLRFLDIIIPVFGYGFLSMIAGHFYSRYAFRRLRSLARAGLEGGEEVDGLVKTGEE